jgi:hypothetical protein
MRVTGDEVIMLREVSAISEEQAVAAFAALKPWLEAADNDDTDDPVADTKWSDPRRVPGKDAWQIGGAIDAELFDLPITIAFGRYREDREFKNHSGTLGHLITSLCTFERGKKDGACLLQGEVVQTAGGTRRQKENMVANHVLMLDFDTGITVEQVQAEIMRLGLFAVVWTTHSHMKPFSDVPEAALLQYLKRTGKLNGHLADMPDDHVINYFRDIKKYEPDILAGAKLVSRKLEEGGVRYRVEHKPMPRMRALFVLKHSFDFAAGVQRDRIEEWKARYAAFSDELSLPWDSSCQDPSRLMYLPRIAPDADISQHQILIINGKTLDFEALPLPEKTRSSASNAFTRAAGNGSDKDALHAAVICHFAKYPDTQIADWYVAHGGEVRHQHPNGVDGRCPTADAHSNGDEPTDRAFHILNADDDRGAHVSCKHATCEAASGKDRAWYIARLMEQFGVGVETLREYSAKARAEAEAENDLPARIDALTPDSTDKDLGEVLEAMALLPEDVKTARLVKRVAKQVDLAASDIKKEVIRKRDRLAAGTSEPSSKADGLDNDLKTRLADYNKRCAVARMGDKTRIIIEPDKIGKNTEFMQVDAFHHLHKSDQLIRGGDGKRLYVSREWDNWRLRRSYKGGVVFAPNGQVSPDVYNLWRGWAVEGVEGDWSLLRRHLFEVVCQRDPFNFAYLMSWLINLVQAPADKPGVAVVVKGSKGTGKSKVAEWVGKLAPHHSLTLNKDVHAFGQFNGHLKEAIFVRMEEPFWAGDKKAEAAFKSMVTDNNQFIEDKGLKGEEFANHLHFWQCSNEDWIVPATPDERRFFCLMTSEEHKKDFPWFAAIDEQMSSGGLAAMMFDLQSLQVPSWVQLRDPPVTPWLVEQINESFGVADKWWQSVLTEERIDHHKWPNSYAHMPRSEDPEDAASIPQDWLVASTEEVFAAHLAYAQRMRLRAMSDTKLGQFLQKHCPLIERVRLRNGMTKERTYCYKFPPVAVLRKAFAERTRVAIGGEGSVLEMPASVDMDALRRWQRYGEGGGRP